MVPIPVIAAAVLVENAIVVSETFLSTMLVLQLTQRSRPTGGEILGIVELVELVVVTVFADALFAPPLLKVCA